MNEVITHEGVQYQKVEREARVGDKVVALDDAGFGVVPGGVYTIVSMPNGYPRFGDKPGHYFFRSQYATLEPLPAAMPKLTDAKPGDRVRIVAADDVEDIGYSNGEEYVVSSVWTHSDGVDVEYAGGEISLYAEEFEVVRELRDHHGDTTEGYADRLADALIQAQNGDVRSRHCVVEPDGKVTCSPPNPGATYHVADSDTRPSDFTNYREYADWRDGNPAIKYTIHETAKSATAEVTQAERIVNACRDLSALLVRKNHDYGDSFAKQYEKYGLTSALIRMDDKLRRLETLNDGEAAQVAESVEDTLIDLAGYALLAAVELRKVNAS